jgi:hypothetical protein
MHIVSGATTSRDPLFPVEISGGVDKKAFAREIAKNPEKILSNDALNFQYVICSDVETYRLEGHMYENTELGKLYLSHEAMDSDSRGPINYLYTPMRASNSKNRYESTNKCHPLDAEVWVTPQQSSCLVGIFKWQSGEVSMLHIQPRKWEAYPKIREHLIHLSNSGAEEKVASFQDAYAEYDMQRIIKNTIDKEGERPVGFILVPSSMDYKMHNLTGRVVGVSSGGDFKFYQQKFNFGNQIPCEFNRLEFKYFNNFEFSEPPELPSVTQSHVAAILVANRKHLKRCNIL